MDSQITGFGTGLVVWTEVGSYAHYWMLVEFLGSN